MKDSIVESVRQDLLDRSELGIKKYNTTLDREDLSAGEWMTHAYQELLDGALYLKRLHKEWGKTQIYVLASDFRELEIKYDLLDDDNNLLKDNYDTLAEDYEGLRKELEVKISIIDTLIKVIKSQEEEIADLKKEEYLSKKRRAWHY